MNLVIFLNSPEKVIWNIFFSFRLINQSLIKQIIQYKFKKFKSIQCINNLWHWRCNCFAIALMEEVMPSGLWVYLWLWLVYNHFLFNTYQVLIFKKKQQIKLRSCSVTFRKNTKTWILAVGSCGTRKRKKVMSRKYIISKMSM